MGLLVFSWIGGDFRSAMRFRPVANAARTYNTVRFDDHRRHQSVLRVLEIRLTQEPRDVEAWLASAVMGYRYYDDAKPGSRPVSRVAPIARASLDRALAIDPADLDALMMRAALRSTPFVAYNPAGALADLSEVIRLAPDQTEAYFRRALVHAVNKPTLALAIQDCEKALALLPGDATLRRPKKRKSALSSAGLGERKPPRCRRSHLFP